MLRLASVVSFIPLSSSFAFQAELEFQWEQTDLLEVLAIENEKLAPLFSLTSQYNLVAFASIVFFQGLQVGS